MPETKTSDLTPLVGAINPTTDLAPVDRTDVESFQLPIPEWVVRAVEAMVTAQIDRLLDVLGAMEGPFGSISDLVQGSAGMIAMTDAIQDFTEEADLAPVSNILTLPSTHASKRAGYNVPELTADLTIAYAGWDSLPSFGAVLVIPQGATGRNITFETGANPIFVMNEPDTWALANSITRIHMKRYVAGATTRYVASYDRGIALA